MSQSMNAKQRPSRRDWMRYVLASSSTTLALQSNHMASGMAARQPSSLRGGFCFESAEFDSCHASSIVEPAPSQLLVTYFAGSREGARDVGIWMSRGVVAEKGSVRWNPPELAHREESVPCWNPVLFRTREGELLHFFKAGPSPREWSGFLRRSRDAGQTWTSPEILPAGILGPVRSKPIQLDDGRLICGSSVESYRVWTCWIEISPDAGRSWSKHGPIAVPGRPYGIIQPTVFQTAEELRFLCRSRGIGRICRSSSSDGGRTWSAAELTELPNPNAGVDALKLRDGRVLLIYNHTPVGRTPLNIAVSRDDGMSFEPRLVLEDEPGEYSYPAIVQADNGVVHCSYTWRRQRIKHVSFDPAQL